MHVVRSLLFATMFVALATGCSFRQPSISQPTVTSAPTPALHLTATALAKQAPLLATLTAQDGFKWDVSIIQNNSMIIAKNGEFQLQPKPFTLRIEVSKPIGIYLNVLDTDNNFKKVHAGLYANDACAHEVHPFCSFAGMTMVAEPGDLAIDRQYEEGVYAFGVDPQLGEVGSQFTLTDNTIIFERYVSQVVFLDPPPNPSTDSTRTVIPVEGLTRDKLYLVFLAKYRDKEQINDDELKKVILSFGGSLPALTPTPIRTIASTSVLSPNEGASSMGFSPIFDIVFALNIALPIVGIASMIMVTIALIQSSKAQRSMARTLERIEQSLKQNGP